MYCVALSQILRQNNLGQAILYLTEIQIYKSGQKKIFRTLLNTIQNKEKKAVSKERNDEKFRQ